MRVPARQGNEQGRGAGYEEWLALLLVDLARISEPVSVTARL